MTSAVRVDSRRHPLKFKMYFGSPLRPRRQPFQISPSSTSPDVSVKEGLKQMSLAVARHRCVLIYLELYRAAIDASASYHPVA